MKIRYLGGRSHYSVTLNRKSYYFTKENRHILDVNDQAVVNYIFCLDNRSEFEVVMEPQEQSLPSQDVKSEVTKVLKKKGRPKKGAKYG